MNEISYKSFQDTVAALLEASPNNSNKGKVMKEWFKSNFAIRATVSNIKEDKQIGNRVVEQFKHSCPIVVFVFDSSLHSDTILNKIRDNVYSALQTVVFVDAKKPYNIVQIFTTEQNEFTSWAERNADIQSQPFPFTINEVESNKKSIVKLNDDDLVEKVRNSFIQCWNIIDQHGADKADYINKFENVINPYLVKLDLGYTHVFQILDIEQYEMIVDLLIKKFPELSYISKGRDNNGTKYQATSTHEHYRNFLRIIALSDFHGNLNAQKDKRLYVAVQSSEIDNSYLRAMRTKPFLLLAGISGTGKSRIVKQMAFDSCLRDGVLDKDPASPGNYCLIEVKPNWHDSTELLGYESKIGGAHYQLTPFVKFLVKAMLYKDVPFFLCLDEMNLAPVEQYFAEFLSVLESRTKVDGHIVSEPLIKKSIFSNTEYEQDLKHELFDVKIKEQDENGVKIYEADLTEEEKAVYEQLKEGGLRIPENLIVVGTVNMDETTHQFSRKVIDRAMTIEMNLPEGEPFMAFFDKTRELAYQTPPASASLYLPTATKASEIIEKLKGINADKTKTFKEQVAKFLTGLNNALEGTPFKVAYRVQNELVLYFYQLLSEFEDKNGDWDSLFTIAANQILMMKVLPRIEGDEELLKERLKALTEYCQPYTNASEKIKEMRNRLDRSSFTSFWP